MSQRQEITTRV